MKVNAQGQEFAVLHNSDWSGEVKIVGPDGKVVCVDGSVLYAIGKAAALDMVKATVVRGLEDLEHGCEG